VAPLTNDGDVDILEDKRLGNDGMILDDMMRGKPLCQDELKK